MARSYRGAGVIRWGAQDGKSPFIGDNGNWWQWNEEIGDYVDTGIKATGTDGEQGATPYPVGSWNNLIAYTRNEKTAPYVEFMGEYYLLTKQGTYTDVIPTNSSVWTKFDKFSQIYAEILLADFAKIGAAVFVDNKLISQYGIDSEGEYSENYQEYPINFIPNSELDLLTGLQKFGKNIVFGRKDGVSVLQYYDNNGQLLYDLGPEGIKEIKVREEGWRELKLVEIAESFERAVHPDNNWKYKDDRSLTVETFYVYISQMTGPVNSDEANDGKIFTQMTKAPQHVISPFKCYTSPLVGQHMQMITDGTGKRLTDLPKMVAGNEIVFDKEPLYYATLMMSIDGKAFLRNYAYWNGNGGSLE